MCPLYEPIIILEILISSEISLNLQEKGSLPSTKALLKMNDVSSALTKPHGILRDLVINNVNLIYNVSI